MYNILITICGRAGSKGFKNKNLKSFLDYPLVYYTLSAAEIFKQDIFDIANVDMCLNTDSDDLSKIVAAKYPEVEYIRREARLGESNVPKPAVWENCVQKMEIKRNTQYDYMIDLDITSPLRQYNDVLNAFNLKLKRQDADLVESMCPARRNPYFNMMKEDGDYVNTVIDCSYVARQQAPNVYDENASIYVLRADYFEEKGYMMNMAKIVPYIMSDTAVLDIDSEEDFVMMEVIARHLYTNEETFRRVRENIRK